MKKNSSVYSMTKKKKTNNLKMNISTCFVNSSCVFRNCSISACNTCIRSSRYWISLCKGIVVCVSSFVIPIIRSIEIVFTWSLFESHLPVRLAVFINDINESKSCFKSRLSWLNFHFSDSIDWLKKKEWINYKILFFFSEDLH